MLVKLLLALALVGCGHGNYVDEGEIDPSPSPVPVPVPPPEKPWFSLKNMRDNSIWHAHEHGKTVLIEFYYNSCPACNNNADNFGVIASRYKGSKHVSVIEIGIDCEERAYVQWMDKHDGDHPVLNGCSAEIDNELGVTSFPTTFVFTDRKQIMKSVGTWKKDSLKKYQDYLDSVNKD